MRLSTFALSAILIIFASSQISYADTTTITTVTNTTVVKPIVVKKHKRANHYKHCYCKKYKHKKRVRKVNPITTYYEPAYCTSVFNPCSCTKGTICVPPRLYHCKTEYYYNDGRDSARVERCF